MATQTCNACRQLRLKCCMDGIDSFSPRCSRCERYDLPCQFGRLPWTPYAMQEFVSRFPEALSRDIFWGASSNSGGHPMDLHNAQNPPLNPSASSVSRSPSPEFPRNHPTATPPTHVPRLRISTKVRHHLYSIFLEHIHPIWPVVQRFDAQQPRPSSVLLDAAILGVAARHHLAIASWRDLKHIRETVKLLLKDLSSLRKVYVADIQSVQALLILFLRIELFTDGHENVLQFPLRLAMCYKMSRDLDLSLSYTSAIEDGADLEEIKLRQNIWAACLYQDAFTAAMLGQPLNVGSCATTDQAYLEKISRVTAATPNPVVASFFSWTVALSFCLRLVLKATYSTNKDIDRVYTQSLAALERIQYLRMCIDANIVNLEKYQHNAIRIIHNNNRLLFVLGLKSTLSTLDGDNEGLHQMFNEQSRHVVEDACQTISYAVPDLLQRYTAQLDLLLYCTTRALMVVVDFLLDATLNPTYPSSFLGQLWSAVERGKDLMAYLASHSSWGVCWTQAQTLKAILARLEFPVASGQDSNTKVTPPDERADPIVNNSDSSDAVLHEQQLSDVLAKSTNWQTFVRDQRSSSELYPSLQAPTGQCYDPSNDSPFHC